MWEYTHYDELMHYGVQGMRWGVRKRIATTRSGGKSSVPSHPDYKRAHDKKTVNQMSDNELRERNNRLQMEKQHKELTKKVSKGKKILNAVLATATTTMTIESIYNKVSKFKNSKLVKDTSDKVFDKVGDMVVKSIDLSGPWD